MVQYRSSFIHKILIVYMIYFWLKLHWHIPCILIQSSFQVIMIFIFSFYGTLVLITGTVRYRILFCRSLFLLSSEFYYFARLKEKLRIYRYVGYCNLFKHTVPYSMVPYRRIAFYHVSKENHQNTVPLYEK